MNCDARDERRDEYHVVRHAAEGCQECPLWEIGTQTVFGTGPIDARLMFIGEAPGRQEDEAGEPFVGPAGAVFNEALAAAGIDRGLVYVTNTVKHRPWVQTESGRGRNRPPKQSEINACAQWLDRELTIIRPEIICCLGAVAAKRILGRDFKLMSRRGEWIESDAAAHVFATVHPSFVMIQRNDSREQWMETFVSDLRKVQERFASLQ